MRLLRDVREVARGGLRRIGPAFGRSSPEIDDEESDAGSGSCGGVQRRPLSGCGGRCGVFRGAGELHAARSDPRLLVQQVAGRYGLRARLRAVHARKAGRRLTAPRVGVVTALTRAFCLAVSAGCAAPQAESVVLRGSDRVVGRAALGSDIAMLTNEPALIRIHATSGELSRHSIRGRDGAKPGLWGLGAIGDALYSVADFKRLVRIESGDAGFQTRDVAQLDHAAGNVLDAPSGMFGQRVVDEPGRPVAARLDGDGKFHPIDAPARVSMGLARAEEGLLHLLTCSVPPRAICWMPGSNDILALDDSGLRHLATLHAVPRIAPTLLIARPTARAIQDALWMSDDLLVVLFQDGGDAGTVMASFDRSGRMVQRIRSLQPLRLLVAEAEGAVLAITREGTLARVAR